MGVNTRNGTDGSSRDPSDDPIVDAKNDYWGAPAGPEEAAFNQDADGDEQSDVVGTVDFEPFLRNPPGAKGGANGNSGGSENGNGNANGTSNGNENNSGTGT